MIWKAKKSESLNTLRGHHGVIASVKFNEVWVVSGSADHTAKVWDTATGSCLYTLNSNVSLFRYLILDISIDITIILEALFF